MIGFPQYHAPFTYRSDLSHVAADPDRFETLAYEIHTQLGQATKEKRRQIFKYHESQCGVETVILPRMKQLFSFLRACPQADKEALWKELTREKSNL
jgi:hypothetical protein